MTPEILNDDPLSTTAIFGGSFDPPHQGHVQIIRTVLSMGRFERLVLALTEQNPLKERRATPWDTRREMLEIVLRAEGLPMSSDPVGTGIYVTDRRYVYTYEIVEHLRSAISPHVTWVIGEDLRTQVGTWRNWDRLRLPLLILPEKEGFRSTEVRDGRIRPHPAIERYIKERKLYAL